MSEVVGEGVIRIKTDESGVDYAGSGKKAGTGFSSGFKSSLKGLAVAVGATLAIGKGIDLLKGSVAEAREAQKVGAATEQIIKATGGAANVSASQVADLAGALSEKAGVDDELIQSGANLLLTFKNVRNEAGKGADIFDRATAAAVDLSAAGFGSVEGGSKMLGKALNDPIAGISALSRAGVTFSAQQKEQIKTMVESGNVLGAQKVILKEVEGQVGGVAAATATAGEKSAVAWGNIKESIGTLLLPILDKLATVFTSKIAPAIQSLIAGTSPLSPVLKAIASAVGALFTSGGKASSFFDGLRSAAETILPIIQQVIITQVLPAVQELISSLRDNFGPVISQLVAVVQTNLVPVLMQLGSFIVTVLVPIWRSLWSFISTAVIPLIATLATFIITQLIPPFLTLVQMLITKLQPVFQQLAETIATKIVPTAQRLVEQIRTQLIPALTPLIQKVIAVIGFLVKLWATVASKVLPIVIKIAGFIISKWVPAFVAVITKVAQFVNGLINFVGAVGRAVAAAVRFASSLQNQVQHGIATVVSAVTALPGKIIALGGRMLEAGKKFMGKLFDGIKAGASAAGGFIAGLAGQLVSAVKGAINSALNLPLEVNFDKGPIHIHATVIPALAKGTSNFAGGLALVGEEGPELVNLPSGARVTPAAATADALAGPGLDAEFFAKLTAALIAALQAVRPVTVVTDAADPEAVAMQVINRLATA